MKVSDLKIINQRGLSYKKHMNLILILDKCQDQELPLPLHKLTLTPHFNLANNYTPRIPKFRCYW
jgi:hypothetical protein